VIDVQKPPSSHKSAVYYTTRIHNHFHLNCSRSHLKSDLLHPLRLILSLVVHLLKFLQNFSNLNPPPPNHIYGEGDREQVTMAAKFPPLKNDILLRAARGTLFFFLSNTPAPLTTRKWLVLGEETERAPVWVMRQAGRYLPGESPRSPQYNCLFLKFLFGVSPNRIP
jgi:hypothetical protein